MEQKKWPTPKFGRSKPHGHDKNHRAIPDKGRGGGLQLERFHGKLKRPGADVSGRGDQEAGD